MCVCVNANTQDRESPEQGLVFSLMKPNSSLPPAAIQPLTERGLCSHSN